MARGKRIRIAACLYRDHSGHDTIVKYRGLRAHERWTLDADVDEMLRWIARSRAELMDRHADGQRAKTPPVSKDGLDVDVTRYLKQRKGKPGYAADASHLKAWITRLGTQTLRKRITVEDVNLAMAAWRTAGVADKTIIHRCRALRDLYRTLDGKHHRCPVAEADVPKTPKPHPVAVPTRVLRKVAAYLAKHAPKKHLARFLVLSTCAQRPCQLERARPDDVDLKRKRWIVRSAKNEPSHTVHLNAEQAAAWKLFKAEGCWQQRAFKQYYRWVHKAGYPTNVSTYNVRHAAAQDALDRGADLGDVQGFLGHTDIETTRRMYAPLLATRQKHVSKLMTGRVTPKT